MNYLLKHLKQIAFFLASLILFQSCVIYNNKPSTLEEFPEQDNTRVKIKTLDGKKYKLYWIEEKDGNIVSITNTKRHVFDTAKIDYVIVGKNDQVHFWEAVNRVGPYIIVAGKKKYNCPKIELRDQSIIGYERKGRNLHFVEIPIDQIKGIYLYNENRSDWGNVLIGIGVVAGVLIGYMLYDMSKGDWITLGN